MTGDADLPEVGYALPINSENRWSDLLAVLIATDPEPACRLLRLGVSPDQVEVEREVTIDSFNRPDLILRVGSRRVVVFEVKVLAGLGPKQLDRYRTAEPGAERYVVIFPERLVVDTRGASPWQPVTHAWVQTCALAWRAHLATALPKVDRMTRWDDLREGEDFVVAMRARASWVFSNLKLPDPVECELVSSAAGASPVVSMFARAAAPNYRVVAEVEERMGVRKIPKLAKAATHSPIGPSVKVVLRQDGVTTSSRFDWDYLLSMWPLMQAARDDWVRSSARPTHPHDKANHHAMVAKGGPKYLGIGFGERQTQIDGMCMFGARYQLPSHITLGDLVTTLEETAELVLQMARVQPLN